MSKPAAARDGQPQHQTKIVVVGVSGKEAADAVGNYHAQLAHFQAAEQQRLLLSPEGVDVHRGYATFNGARAVYTNSFGQETITLHVTPQHEPEEERPTSPDFWDYVLVEIEVPAGNSQVAEFSAWLVTDRADPIYALADGSHEGSKDNILRYPDGTNKAVPTVRTVADTTYKASLLVDLRGFQHEGAAAAVDLHGRLKPYLMVGLPTDPEQTYTVLSSTQFSRYRINLDEPSQFSVFTNADTFEKLQTSFPDHMDNTVRSVNSTYNYYLAPGESPDNGYQTLIGGRFQAVPLWNDSPVVVGGATWQPAGWSYSYADVSVGHSISGADPNTYMAGFAAAYSDGPTEYWAGTSIAKFGRHEGCVVFHGYDGTTTYDNTVSPDAPSTGFTINMYDIDYLYLPLCQIGGKVQSTLNYVFFKGNPFDAKSLHNVTIPDGTDPSEDDGVCVFYLWERADRPDRWPMHKSKKAPLVPIVNKTGTTTLENRFQLPKMGTISINPRIGQESVAYKAA